MSEFYFDFTGLHVCYSIELNLVLTFHNGR